MKRLFVIYFILLCVLTACSPQQRVARIVKKYNLPTVTEYVSDTVVIPARVRTDTVVLRGEPVLIEDTAFITELVPVNDTTYIVKTTIKADTIIKKVPVSKYVVQDIKKTVSIVEWIWIISALIAYIVLGFFVIRALCKKM